MTALDRIRLTGLLRKSPAPAGLFYFHRTRLAGSPSKEAWPLALRNLDLPLEDLPCRTFREILDKPDFPRVLVRRDTLLDVLAQLVVAGTCALLQRDRGCHLLAVLVMGNAQHGGLANIWMLVEHFLDLARVDVVAASDDHLLLAIDDEEVTVFIDLRHIARVKPAVANRLGGGVVLVPVALHHVVPPDHDLADLARRHLVALIVDDSHLDSFDWRPDRSRLALPVRVIEGG